MNFLFEDKIIFRSRDICVFVKSTNFKICDVIIGIATQWKLHLCLFILNPKYYKKKLSNTSVLYEKHF